MKCGALLLVIILILAACGQPPTAQSVIEDWKAEGLEVAEVQELVGDNLPPGAISGVQFTIPSHCRGCGGKVIVFESADAAAVLGGVWEIMGEHVYLDEGLLIQINGKIEAGVAERYQMVSR